MATHDVTDAMAMAAAREAWRIGAERFGASRWEDQSQDTRVRVLADQRRVLTAALSAAPVSGDGDGDE
jgi:hypothetical protein